MVHSFDMTSFNFLDMRMPRSANQEQSAYSELSANSAWQNQRNPQIPSGSAFSALSLFFILCTKAQQIAYVAASTVDQRSGEW
jgi:hypothetical protein